MQNVSKEQAFMCLSDLKGQIAVYSAPQQPKNKRIQPWSVIRKFTEKQYCVTQTMTALSLNKACQADTVKQMSTSDKVHLIFLPLNFIAMPLPL